MADVISPLEQPIPILNIPLWQVLLIGAIVFIVYLVITAKPKAKEFKPLDLKKETKKRFKKDYKYMGVPLGKPIYGVKSPKPLAFVIGYMKVVEMKAMKRLEPVYTNYSPDKLKQKQEDNAKAIYDKPFESLNDVEKRSINEVAKEEVRNEKVEEMPLDENVKVVRGQKLIRFTNPVPLFAFKVCSPDIFSKLLARTIGIRMDWWVVNEAQIDFKIDRVDFVADFQRRYFNDIFVFSKEGKSIVQDVGFTIEREEFMGATANSIQRVLFNNDTARDINIRREDANIEKDKHRAQKESHDFG